MNQYYLCSIWKNEANALLEWIAFHRKLDFNLIHIFDNNSTDGSREMLAKISTHGIIKHTVFDSVDNQKSPQIEAYRIAAATARSQGFDWLLFIDADEFIVPYTADSIDQLTT